ncbi:MAG TPA: helix-turn-helix domain-containing protein [Cellulomonas sp.]
MTSAPGPSAARRATPEQVRHRPPTDGRTRRAVATRARIAAAAGALFVEQGYATTSIAGVARAAGVGVQTVYYSYGSKAEILVGALDHGIDGADHPNHPDLPPDPTDLPWVRIALDEPDPVRRLFLHVRGAADLMGRTGRLLEVVRGAGAGEPIVQWAWTWHEERLRAAHRVLVRSYPGDRSARDVERVLDVVALTLGAQVWDALVVRAGWTALEWARWAHRSLLGELMPDRLDAVDR